MDPRNQNSRAAARPATRESQNTALSSETPTQNFRHGGAKRHGKKVTAAFLVALLLVAGAAGWHKFGPTPGVQSDKFQAVFLDNDQVYFGKIRDIERDTLILTDIYYLQKQSGDQQSVSQASSDSTAQGNLSLVKLGDELHAPQDEMRINRDQVVFWENLKDDGKVAQAIKNYKK